MSVGVRFSGMGEIDLFPLKQTYSVAEAAAILGIGRSAAYAAAKSGDIPTIKIGKRFLVPKKALEKLLGE